MPTIPSIRTSVENKNVFIFDQHAKSGTFKRDARGRLLAYVGGFSAVFPYEASTGEMWALRCWHSDIGSLKNRYEKIVESIKNVHLDFLCDFEYIETGIAVDGVSYPITRMQWIDGFTIKDYICQNKNRKQVLVSLAEKFLNITKELHNHSLAHGDLQHGNILVDKNHQLYLVDYDSFYCPELKGAADEVIGLPDYQHPSRRQNRFVSEKLDYFSELIIYLSILAIAENPLLVDKYKIKDADRLLFAKEDFFDITHSQIYDDIKILGNDFQDLLDVLVEYLASSSIDELLPFDLVLLKKQVKLTASTTKVIRNTQEVVIEWNVPFDADVKLIMNQKKEETCAKSGVISTTLNESVSYKLLIEMPCGVRISKQISVDVFDECIIQFWADKYYTLPSVPVELSWDVKHANRVWLDGNEVNSIGNRVIEPNEAETFTLSAEDEFGKKEKQVEIKILPLPVISTIMVDAPKIQETLSISCSMPKFESQPMISKIETDFVDIKLPQIPSLKDSGFYVSLQQKPQQSLIKQFSQFLKKIYFKILDYDKQ